MFPKSQGGWQRVLCCYRCNTLKGNKIPTIWLAYVLREMPQHADRVRAVFRSFEIKWSEPGVDTGLTAAE